MERGMSGATVQEICKQAGVTTGAIQHHFGSKTGLMAEVVRTLFTPFVSGIEPAGGPEPSLETRIARIIDHYWSIFQTERYFAVLEVLLATRHDPDLLEMVAGFREGQLKALEEALPLDFPELDISASEFRNSMHRAIDYMRGHAVRRIYENSDELDRQAIEAARAMVLRDLTENKRDSR